MTVKMLQAKKLPTTVMLVEAIPVTPPSLMSSYQAPPGVSRDQQPYHPRTQQGSMAVYLCYLVLIASFVEFKNPIIWLQFSAFSLTLLLMSAAILYPTV